MRDSTFDADAVLTDNTTGVRQGVEHLLAAGHRRIAYLGDQLSIATARQRYDGFLQAMSSFGLPTAPRQVATGLHIQGPSEAAVRAMLDQDEPPTALFCGQNNVTIAALRVLHQLGMQRQVALVGFDDLGFADLVDPGVTVIAQDPSQIGRLAAERVFARLAGDSSPARTEIVPTRLIARGSGEIPPA